jgi:sec-independent protein translocase protein TatC
MASAIRTIRHEDRLSLVEHLAELRTRLIICAITLAVAFGICAWQNHALLSVVNAPLAKQTLKQIEKGNGTLGQTAIADKALIALSTTEQKLITLLSSSAGGLKPALAAQLAPLKAELAAATAKVPRKAVADKPVTLGIGEPFTSTITIAFYFALLISLPLILFQIYAFVLPAFSPTERQIAMPLMLAIPFLFIVGVLFGYFVVFPASVRFFQNFNSTSFNVLVQASAYYRFEALILLAMGLIFQVPVGILAATRAGIVTPRQLRKNRRYAVVVAALIAALLPGDAITMALETAPLVLLFEISVQLATFLEKRTLRRAAADAVRAAAAAARATPPSPAGGAPPAPGGAPPAPGGPPPAPVGPPPASGGPPAPVGPPPAPVPLVAVPETTSAGPPANDPTSLFEPPSVPSPPVEPLSAPTPPVARRRGQSQPKAQSPAVPAAPPLAPPPTPPPASPPRPTEEEDDNAL